MNYYTDDNPDIIAAVAGLLKCEESSIEHVKVAVSNPNNGNDIVMTLEIYPVPTLDALFFIYTGGKTLHDVIAFRGKRFARVNRNGESAEHIDRLNNYLLKHVTDALPGASKEIYTEDDEQDKLRQKDQQIKQLQNRNRLDRERVRIEKDVAKSLRQQIKTLRAKKNPSP